MRPSPQRTQVAATPYNVAAPSFVPGNYQMTNHYINSNTPARTVTSPQPQRIAIANTLSP